MHIDLSYFKERFDSLSTESTYRYNTMLTSEALEIEVFDLPYHFNFWSKPLLYRWFPSSSTPKFGRADFKFYVTNNAYTYIEKEKHEQYLGIYHTAEELLEIIHFMNSFALKDFYKDYYHSFQPFKRLINSIYILIYHENQEKFVLWEEVKNYLSQEDIKNICKHSTIFKPNNTSYSSSHNSWKQFCEKTFDQHTFISDVSKFDKSIHIVLNTSGGASPMIGPSSFVGNGPCFGVELNTEYSISYLTVLICYKSEHFQIRSIIEDRTTENQKIQVFHNFQQQLQYAEEIKNDRNRNIYNKEYITLNKEHALQGYMSQHRYFEKRSYLSYETLKQQIIKGVQEKNKQESVNKISFKSSIALDVHPMSGMRWVVQANKKNTLIVVANKDFELNKYFFQIKGPDYDTICRYMDETNHSNSIQHYELKYHLILIPNDRDKLQKHLFDAMSFVEKNTKTPTVSFLPSQGNSLAKAAYRFMDIIGTTPISIKKFVLGQTNEAIEKLKNT